MYLGSNKGYNVQPVIKLLFCLLGGARFSLGLLGAALGVRARVSIDIYNNTYTHTHTFLVSLLFSGTWYGGCSKC